PLELPDAVPSAEVLELLRPLLEDRQVRKLSVRGKHDRIVMCQSGVGCVGLSFDAVVASYLLNPGRRNFSLEDLALEFLGERPRPTSGLLEGGGPVTLQSAAEAAAQEAELALRLAEPLVARLAEQGLTGVYEEMELPLIEVLSDMEVAGVKVNQAL